MKLGQNKNLSDQSTGRLKLCRASIMIDGAVLTVRKGRLIMARKELWHIEEHGAFISLLHPFKVFLPLLSKDRADLRCRQNAKYQYAS